MAYSATTVLPLPGRRGDDDMAVGVDGVDRVELEAVEGEVVCGESRSARMVTIRRVRSALRPLEQPSDRARTIPYRTINGPASAISEIGSPDGVITAASTKMATIA